MANTKISALASATALVGTEALPIVQSGSTKQVTAASLLRQTGGLRVVTAAGAVTVAATDDKVVINKTVGAATTANLSATPATNQTHVIKDGKGDAAVNNITITPAAGTIDGAATFVMNTPYQSATVVYNGTEWNLI